MKSGDLLVEDLWKLVDFSLLVFLGSLVLPEIDLSKSLVGERARHNERWVTSGTSQVEESTLSKDDDTVSVWELESVHLWFDLNLLDSWVGLETFHINFIIEMTNVSNDGVVLHLSHILSHNNSLVSSGGNEDVGSADDLLKFF